MKFPTVNAAFTTCFVLLGSIILTSCSSVQNTDETNSTPDIIATSLPTKGSSGIKPLDIDSTLAKGKNTTLSSLEISTSPNLSKVLQLALVHHPQIQAAGLEHVARRAEVQQAARIPNPELEVELENFGGSGSFSGFGGSETTVAVTQLIELGNKRELRTNEAIESLRVAASQFDAIRLEVFQDTSSRFYEAMAAQEELKVATEMLSSARRLEQVVNARVRAGRANILEQQRVSLISSRAKVNHDQTKLRHLNSLRALASVIGLPSTQLKSVTGNLFKVAPPLAESLLRAHLANTPQAQRAATEVARRQATLARVQSERISDLTLSAGTRFDQDSDDHAFVASVGLPIPVFNRNEDAIAAAQARLDQSTFERQAQDINLETLFTERYSALVSTAQQTLTLQKELIPAARENFKTSNRAYQRGSIDLVSLISSQQTVSELELESVRSAAQYQLARIALQSLLGRSVTPLHTTTQ